MGRTTRLERLDRKLHRLRKIEASYRHWIKRAHDELKHETVDRDRAEKRFEKIRANYTRKIEKLQPKIRDLTVLRSELKGAEG